MMLTSGALALIAKMTMSEWVSVLTIFALFTTIVFNLLGWIERGSKLYRTWKARKIKEDEE